MPGGLPQEAEDNVFDRPDVLPVRQGPGMETERRHAFIAAEEYIRSAQMIAYCLIYVDSFHATHNS